VTDAGRKPTAAELLGTWRAAEREVVAARESADTATVAADAADDAVIAAKETGDAARLSTEAAQLVERSAIRTAEVAEAAARVAQKEKLESEEPLVESVQVAAEAGDAYRDAQREGFPRA
jgi:hypothetical protein